MMINTNKIFYTGENTDTNTRKVLLTDYKDVQNAVNNGQLTVDGVTIELSKEARSAIQKAQDLRMKNCEMINEYNTAIDNANAAKQQGEVMEEIIDEQTKALEIARRIAGGGHVPLKDEQLLMDYSSELYQMAKQQAMLAKEHEKYKSLIEEEEHSEETDAEEGKISTKHHVQVEVAMGETLEVIGVSEVAVEVE